MSADDTTSFSSLTVDGQCAIEITSSEPLDAVIVIVSSLGRVIEAKTIRPKLRKQSQPRKPPNVKPAPQTTFIYDYTFKLSFDGVPRGDILIYRIKDNKIKVTKTEFNLRELNNFLNVTLSKPNVKPGENVDINVQTKPDSNVALVGVDQSVLLLAGKGYDVSLDDVLGEIETTWNQAAARSEDGNIGRGFIGIPWRGDDLWQFSVRHSTK